MRASSVLLGALLGAVSAAHTARAETVVVLSPPGADLDAALRVAMEGRGVAVAGAPVPAAGLRLERAAMAQRAALEIGASAAVWLDDAEVCAVTADGHELRHAPFPRDAASPRAFAAIATSLLDEMIHPEPWAQDVNVNVQVDITPHDASRARVAFAESPVPAPIGAPGMVRTDVYAVPYDEPRAHAGQTLLELGPMLSPLTAGLQGAVVFPLSPAWRLGGSAAINKTWDGDYTLGVFAAELRHVGRGRAKHWDIGPEVGYASDGKDPVAFVGARIARTWELSTTALSLGFSPMLIAPLDYSASSIPVLPAIYGSLRWQVAL